MKTLFAITALAATLFISDADAAQMRNVTFESHGEKMVGTLYLPDSYREGDKLPGIVVTGAWTTVKEQMPATYAQAMANKGYATLAFDFRNWGESGGKERQLESPNNKTEDIVTAANYLATRPEVNANKVAGLGICASAGYMVGAAIQTDVIKSVALVAPWLHDRAIVNAVYGGEAKVNALIVTGRKAEGTYRQTGALALVPAASDTDKTAIMQNAAYYTNPKRGLIPTYRNEFNLASWEGWLTFDSVALADKLKKPTLIVHSEAAAIPQGAHAFYARLSTPKQQLWLNNVTQFDFYDQSKAIASASDAAAKYFNATLK